MRHVGNHQTTIRRERKMFRYAASGLRQVLATGSASQLPDKRFLGQSCLRAPLTRAPILLSFPPVELCCCASRSILSFSHRMTSLLLNADADPQGAGEDSCMQGMPLTAQTLRSSHGLVCVKAALCAVRTLRSCSHRFNDATALEHSNPPPSCPLPPFALPGRGHASSSPL